MTRCESYPPCFETIYFPTAPFLFDREFRRSLLLPSMYLQVVVYSWRLI